MAQPSLKLGIFPKVLGALISVAVLVSLVALYVASQSAEVCAATERVFTDHFEPTTVIAGVNDDIQRYRARALRHMLDTDPKSLEKLESELQERATSAEVRLDKYAALKTDPRLREEVARIRKNWLQFAKGVGSEVLPKSRAGDKEAAFAAYQPLAKIFSEINAAVDTLTASGIKDARADFAAAAARATAARRVSTLAMLGALLASIVLGFLVARSIVRPINAMVRALEEVARGKLNQDWTVESSDEVGAMASSLSAALASIRGALHGVSQNATALTAASEEVATVSRTMAGSADESSSQASMVAAAAEEVSANLQTVATGAEELSATVQEIARNVTEASRVANSAVQTVTTTDATIAKLGESSAEIGAVLKTITAIAQQTNLLALNATIEAARAGEAGKGFAVVANEVKELAKQTAAATEDIGRKIDAIQSDAKSAVAAMSEIGAVVRQINDIQGTISTAVEEQSATTNEINRNVAEAAKASSEIAQNISGVAKAAGEAASGAGVGQKAATGLSSMAGTLQGLLVQFQLT